MPNTIASSDSNHLSFNVLNMSSLAERLSDTLRAVGMTRAALARAAGVSRATVTLWMDGTTRSIHGENLTRAAAALRVSAHWLATGEGPMQVSGTQGAQARYEVAPSATPTRARAATLTADEMVLLDGFRVADATRRVDMLDMARKALAARPPLRKPASA